MSRRRYPHVLHIIDSLAAGGAERMAVELANATRAAGCSVTLCVSRTTATLASAVDRSVAVHVLGRTRRWDFAKLGEFVRYCRLQEVAVVHAHGFSSYLFCLGANGLGLRSPVVLHEHSLRGGGVAEPPLSRRYQLTLRCLRPWFVGVHPRISATARAAGIPEHRVRTIRNALDLTAYAEINPNGNVHTGVLRGIMLANVRPPKDIETMLRALTLLPRPLPHVTIVGSLADAPYVAACRQLVHDLELTDAVEFAGEDLDVVARMRDADFALLSSSTESGPLALIEYMAAALPFVATNAGQVAAHAAEVGLPGIVPAGDVLSYSSALGDMLGATAAERRARGVKGREFARLHYDVRGVLPEWEAVYRAMLQG